MLKQWLYMKEQNVAVRLVRKCASTAISNGLSDALGLARHKPPQLHPALNPCEEPPDGARKAIFIRNPFKRMESFWCHVIVEKQAATDGLKEAGYTPKMPFEDCVLLTCENVERNEHVQPYPQGDFEFIGTLEHMEKSWEQFCLWAGIPHNPLPVENYSYGRPLSWSLEATKAFTVAYERDIIMHMRALKL